MRKTVLAILALSCVLLSGCLSKDKATALPNGKYLLDGNTDIITPYVLILDNNNFEFYYSVYSSYFAHGTYEIEADKLIMTTEDGKYVFVFQIKDGKIYYNLKQSSTVPKINGEEPIKDGEQFVLIE